MLWGFTHREPVGRDDQLRVLETCLRSAMEGTSSGAILDGDAGVGKSTLLEALARAASKRGSFVAVGACLPIPSLPYAPILQILRSLRTDDIALGDHTKAMAAALHPLLSTGAETAFGAPRQERRTLVFEQYLDLINSVAESVPLIIGLEDLQWVDTDSAELILFLIRNLGRRGALMFIATQRSDVDPPAATRELLLEIRRSPGITRLTVPPLTDETVRTQVGQLAGDLGIVLDEEQIATIVSRAEGIPFYVEELVLTANDPQTTIPSSLMHVFRGRLAQLPNVTRDVLQVAAVAGRQADPAVLRGVLGCSQAGLARAVRPAVRAAFLRFRPELGPGACAFRHSLVREAILADLDGAGRQRLHRRLAEALERLPGGVAGAARATEIAYHWDAAGASEALGAHMRAGTAALAIQAFAAADQHLARAVELWRHGEARQDEPSGAELLRSAAETAYLCGRADRAVDLMREAVARVDHEADPMRAGLLYERLGEYQLQSAGPASSAEAETEALRLIPSDPPSAERASVLRSAGSRARWLGRHREAIAILADALAMARATGATSVEVASLSDMGLARCLVGELEAGWADLEDARRMVDSDPAVIDPAVRLWPVESMFGVILGLTGDLDRAVDLARGALQTNRDLGGSRLAMVDISAGLVESLYLLGRWDEAADQIATLGPTTIGQTLARTYVDAHGAQLNVSRGLWDEAREPLDSVRARAAAAADPWLEVFVESVEADLAAWRLDLDAVRRATRRGWASAWPTGAAFPEPETELAAAELLWHGTRAEADTAQGARRDTAVRRRAAAEEAAALARKSRSLLEGRTPYGPRWRDRLMILQQMTEQEAARARGTFDPDTWQAIIDRWNALRMPYPATYASFRLSESLFRGRRRSAAAAVLAEAHGAALELDAQPLCRRIEDMARRSRTHLPSLVEGMASAVVDHTDGVVQARSRTHVILATLSGREREVAAMLANGHSNREVAERLFVTERTAAAHVSSILRKLGVSRRTEVAVLWLRGQANDG